MTQASSLMRTFRKLFIAYQVILTAHMFTRFKLIFYLREMQEVHHRDHHHPFAITSIYTLLCPAICFFFQAVSNIP